MTASQGWFLIGGTGDGEVFSVPVEYSIFTIDGGELYFGCHVRRKWTDYRVAVAEGYHFDPFVAGILVERHLAMQSGIDYDTPLVRRLN